MHFAGRGDTQRGRMTRFMNAFEGDNGRWDLEVGETEMEGEFWEGWKGVERGRRGMILVMSEMSERGAGVGDESGERETVGVKADLKASQEARALGIEDRPRWK